MEQPDPVVDARPMLRGEGGRFLPGTRGGPGNLMAKRTHELRTALYSAVTEADIAAAVRKLIELARGGDVVAIRELLDRTIGKPHEADLVDRLAVAEQLLKEALEHTRGARK